MGGHVEDEEEEAEQSHEIQEGRLENTARREIWRAVAHMTSTEQALAAHDTGAALAAAMKAVEALQKRLHAGIATSCARCRRGCGSIRRGGYRAHSTR